MSVKIRMTRIGRRHRPFFRINAIESRNPRDGRILEKLGHYDPLEKNVEKQVVIDRERIEYWLDNGAIPSDTVSDMLLRHGIKHKYAEQRAARRERAKLLARAKGKFFTKDERIAAEKAAEKAAAEADAKAKADAKAEADAKAKAEAEAKTKAEAEEKANAKAEAVAEQAPAVEETPAAEEAPVEAEQKPETEQKPEEPAEQAPAEEPKPESQEQPPGEKPAE